MKYDTKNTQSFSKESIEFWDNVTHMKMFLKNLITIIAIFYLILVLLLIIRPKLYKIFASLLITCWTLCFLIAICKFFQENDNHFSVGLRPLSAVIVFSIIFSLLEKYNLKVPLLLHFIFCTIIFLIISIRNFEGVFSPSLTLICSVIIGINMVILLFFNDEFDHYGIFFCSNQQK